MLHNTAEVVHLIQ